MPPSSSTAAAKQRTSSAQPSFESALQRLGEIVDKLEGGELPLEDSLRLFEEGVRLSRTAQAQLDDAEKRVEELLGIDEAGNPIVRELEVDE